MTPPQNKSAEGLPHDTGVVGAKVPPQNSTKGITPLKMELLGCAPTLTPGADPQQRGAARLSLL